MRELTLKKFWEKRGAKFVSDANRNFVADFGTPSAEYAALRSKAVIADFSFSRVLSFDESTGLEFLDSVLAANIMKLRYGRMLETYIADKSGNVAVSVLAADIDDKIILVCESIDDASLAPLFDAKVRSSDMSESHVLISADGPLSWKIAREFFGADIFNLSFLSCEKYKYRSFDVYLFRCGKTGEFGYQFLVPNSVAEQFADEITAIAEKLGGRTAGFAAHSTARMEGNFFNVYAEGKIVRNPIELGLQPMTDFDKESFHGSEPVKQFRKTGAKRKLVAAQAEKSVNVGDAIYDDDVKIGECVAASEFPIDGNTCLALVKADFAYPSLVFSSGIGKVKTVSRPTVVTKSLLDGMDGQ